MRLLAVPMGVRTLGAAGNSACRATAGPNACREGKHTAASPFVREWPLREDTIVAFGSGHDGPRFEYAAGKLPSRFWVPEAATRQRVLATRSGQQTVPLSNVCFRR
jgi:hypothetical protein